MINDIIQQHKLEKEKLLSKAYIAREQIPHAEKFLNSELVKVITGPRRAGKSVFAFLLLKDKDFAYINFEDENLLKIKNYDEIIQGIFEVYPDINRIFFDEIQDLPNWEIFVNKLHRRGYNLILTGSNANLLSKEMASALTGRYIPIEILPFSFKEFLLAKNRTYQNGVLFSPENKGSLLNLLRIYLCNL